jgi:hypothetical protein
MEGRNTNIDKQALELFAGLIRARQSEIRLIGGFVRSGGNLADGRARAQQKPHQQQRMMAADECPDGWHDEGGVCVPD